jgi:hypothetical protein
MHSCNVSGELGTKVFRVKMTRVRMQTGYTGLVIMNVVTQKHSRGRESALSGPTGTFFYL